MSELEIRKAVKERYAKIATSSEADCCGGAGCNDATIVTLGGPVPTEASSVNAGCGSPLQLVSPRKGDAVLDLGSGGGIDVFRASVIIGEKGKAIGVDATPEMVWRARETKSKYGRKYANAESRLGEIEHLPIESGSVDYVISNCVINLSPDKKAVFDEAFRVLKGGGTFAVADVTLPREIPASARKDMDSWSACIAGALTDSEYGRLLERAGFQDVGIEHVSDSNIGEYPFPYHSSHIKAKKPFAPTSATGSSGLRRIQSRGKPARRPSTRRRAPL
jgi:arsenite methyltransferase